MPHTSAIVTFHRLTAVARPSTEMSKKSLSDAGWSAHTTSSKPRRAKQPAVIRSCSSLRYVCAQLPTPKGAEQMPLSYFLANPRAPPSDCLQPDDRSFARQPASVASERIVESRPRVPTLDPLEHATGAGATQPGCLVRDRRGLAFREGRTASPGDAR